MKNTVKTMCVLVLAGMMMLVLSSCAITKIMPGAEQVRVINTEPKDCIFLGEVIGGETNGNSVDKAQGALNDLKNKAYKMGGTVVVLLNANANSVNVSGANGMVSSSTDVVLMGAVYKCK